MAELILSIAGERSVLGKDHTYSSSQLYGRGRQKSSSQFHGKDAGVHTYTLVYELYFYNYGCIFSFLESNKRIKAHGAANKQYLHCPRGTPFLFPLDMMYRPHLDPWR